MTKSELLYSMIYGTLTSLSLSPKYSCHSEKLQHHPLPRLFPIPHRVLVHNNLFLLNSDKLGYQILDRDDRQSQEEPHKLPRDLRDWPSRPQFLADSVHEHDQNGAVDKA
ncbi:hypothetical protein TorRG33x02_218480 [Trema orientale]|uniref:Uncharacterized protein n=1 Tax=Trema orientale TaxID=63057 RepID=A0A2P5E9X6_TREOI|nr:hypothetical protein TorRG33x02_218480 [Trema orientale]